MLLSVYQAQINDKFIEKRKHFILRKLVCTVTKFFRFDRVFPLEQRERLGLPLGLPAVSLWLAPEKGPFRL